MKSSLQPGLLLIPIGVVVGLIAAATVIETEPAFLGWIMGTGLGLMGGSFLAAITSGEQLVSGPAPKRGGVGAAAPWLDASRAEEAEETEGDDETEEDSTPAR